MHLTPDRMWNGRLVEWYFKWTVCWFLLSTFGTSGSIITLTRFHVRERKRAKITQTMCESGCAISPFVWSSGSTEENKKKIQTTRLRGGWIIASVWRKRQMIVKATSFLACMSHLAFHLFSLLCPPLPSTTKLACGKCGHNPPFWRRVRSSWRFHG